MVLRGEAGAGKSRLLRESTAELDGLVLSGRAVPGDSPVPYRPLSEAFLAAFRERPHPRHPSLIGFESQLARLIPGWEASTPVDDSPVLLGEAIVRLLSVLSEGGTCALVLEDLHWADSETLAVVEYLGDALRHESILCLGTSRPGGPIGALLDRLGQRDPATVVDVGSLGDTGIERMVAACLGTGQPPAGLSEFVQLHSDGNPFLVEELLAGLVATGTLDRTAGRWEINGPLNPAVPTGLRESIQQRLGGMDPADRRVLGAAALLGRHFAWELLPGIAEVDGRAAVAALRAAVAEQLIESDGDSFRFRHALTREAVLADLIPPERRALAARAWRRSSEPTRACPVLRASWRPIWPRPPVTVPPRPPGWSGVLAAPSPPVRWQRPSRRSDGRACSRSPEPMSRSTPRRCWSTFWPPRVSRPRRSHSATRSPRPWMR